MVDLPHDAAGSASTYRALFEGSPHATLLVDYRSLRVLRANDAAAAEYGYTGEELVHLPLETLWPGAQPVFSRQRAGEAIERRAAWRHLRKGGEAIDVEIVFQALAFAGRPAVALHVSNVTRRAFSLGLLEAHNRVLDLVSRASPLSLVLEELVLAMERLSSGMIASVLLLDEDGRVRHGAAPNLPPTYWQAIDGLPIGPRSGSCGAAMHLGRPVIVADIARDPLWDDYRAYALPHGLSACWSVPVRSGAGRILGAFALYYREPGAPSERDLRLVEAGAALAAIAIERERAGRVLQESEARLRSILDHAFALVWLKDVEGRYQMVNRRFEEATGISAAVALGRTDRQLFPQALADACTARDGEVLQTRRAVQFEQELPPQGGAPVYLAVKFPLLRPDGSPHALCCIALDVTQHRSAERRLQESLENLRALADRLHNVREQERARISRDIHDHLGQMLTGLQMNQSLLVRSVREAGSVDREAVAAQLESMQELVGELLSTVRRIATDLRPEVLDTLGLEAALEWQASEFSRRTGIACSVSLPGGAVQAGTEPATALFRICQEALSNVARHSAATRVQVELRREGPVIEMSIADNGRGMAPAADGASASLGLLGMRERIALLGGTIDITGEPGRGTTVFVRVPVE